MSLYFMCSPQIMLSPYSGSPPAPLRHKHQPTWTSLHLCYSHLPHPSSFLFRFWGLFSLAHCRPLQFLSCLEPWWFQNLHDGGFKTHSRHFPGGPVVNNLLCNVEDVGSIHGKTSHAMEKLSSHTPTTEPVGSGAHMPQVESPYASTKSPRAATKTQCSQNR